MAFPENRTWQDVNPVGTYVYYGSNSRRTESAHPRKEVVTCGSLVNAVRFFVSDRSGAVESAQSSVLVRGSHCGHLLVYHAQARKR